MSTDNDNIEGLDGIDELIGKIGPRVTQRRKQIETDRTGRITHEANLALGVAAAMKRSRNKRAALDEEDDELDDIERMAGALIDAANGQVPEAEVSQTPDPVPAIVTIEDITPTPEPEPAPIPEVVPEPTCEQPVPVVVRRTNVVTFLGGSWSRLCWFLALIGLVIGLIVASATTGFDKFTGTGHAWFTFAWIIGLCGVGFFGGGFFGTLIDRRRTVITTE